MGSLHNQWSDCQKQYQYQLHYLQCKNNCMVWNETCCGTTTSFPVKWCQRNECRGSIPMTYRYPNLGSASDWSYHKGNLFQPIKALPRSEKWHVISTDFCACYPDIISQGNRWCRHKMLAVFSGWVWLNTLSFTLSLGVTFWLQKLHDVFKQSFWS